MFEECIFAVVYLFWIKTAYSHKNLIKTEYQATRLSDDHLEQCLRLAVSNYSHDCGQLVNEMQCHPSTMPRWLDQ